MDKNNFENVVKIDPARKRKAANEKKKTQSFQSGRSPYPGRSNFKTKAWNLAQGLLFLLLVAYFLRTCRGGGF